MYISHGKLIHVARSGCKFSILLHISYEAIVELCPLYMAVNFETGFKNAVNYSRFNS